MMAVLHILALGIGYGVIAGWLLLGAAFVIVPLVLTLRERVRRWRAARAMLARFRQQSRCERCHGTEVWTLHDDIGIPCTRCLTVEEWNRRMAAMAATPERSLSPEDEAAIYRLIRESGGTP